LKRSLIAVLALLLALAGTAYAVSDLMTVSINGKGVVFKSPPKFEDNILMVPLAEVAQSLGIEARWNVGTNTLEVTDQRDATITSLTKQLTEANAELLKLKSPPVGQPIGAELTKNNLVSSLNDKYGSLAIGDKTIHVTWSRNPVTGEDDPLFRAELTTPDYITVLMTFSGANVLKWFNDAAGQIALIYPAKSSAVLVYYDIRTSYPTAKYDNVRLTSDYKWSVTDYVIWSFISGGAPSTKWDD
jgi:hypothetical protein